MIDIPRQWRVSGQSEMPSLPATLTDGKLWVRVNDRELHAVSALDQDAGWAEVIACDKDGKFLVTQADDGLDVIRVRVVGKVEQGIR